MRRSSIRVVVVTNARVAAATWRLVYSCVSGQFHIYDVYRPVLY